MESFVHGDERLRRISFDSESTSVFPEEEEEEEWVTPLKKKNKPSTVLVNILFVLILMEFQRFTNAISETLPPLGVKK